MNTEKEIIKNISKSISELSNHETIMYLINKALAQKIPVEKIIEDGMRVGLDDVGKKYESGEYFLSELMYAGNLVEEALKLLEPHLGSINVSRTGRIVLGTVRGDIHDIGKNIFGMLLKVSGFEVYDLGVDVEPETFREAVKKADANILALSALLNNTRIEAKAVIEELWRAGLRNNVKVLLGGNAMTKEFALEVGADDVALDAVQGIEICKRWMAG